jgi:hypothetical protein
VRKLSVILGMSVLAACGGSTPQSTEWEDYEPPPDDPVPHAATDDPEPEPEPEPGDDDSSSGFVPSTDAGDGIPSCDPWDLDACGEGQKCTGYSPSGGGLWNETRCVPTVEEPKAIGEPCSYDGAFEDGFDDCEKGAVCWDVMLLQGEEVGTCVPICIGDVGNPHCADDENYSCNVSKASIGLCLPKCTPIEDDCPVGCSCLPDVWSTFVCIPNQSGGEGAYGIECQYVNSCNPGLFCADAAFVPGCDGGQGCCTYFCDITDPSICEEGTECVPWYEEGMAPPGYENVGGCGVLD